MQILADAAWLSEGAAENKATVSEGNEGGKKVTVLTFMDGNGHKIVGDIDDQNMVTKVDSWLPNPVLGDMLVETTFTDYKDFGGIKFPGPHRAEARRLAGVGPDRDEREGQCARRLFRFPGRGT